MKNHADFVPDFSDISPDFRGDKSDSQVLRKILPHEATPEAIKLFARHAWKLTDYAYWFGLSTLWVSYTGWSDIELWKRLFSSKRSGRETSLMKPSEWGAFQSLPDPLTLYRAHRPGEQDWISYTISPGKAAEFAVRRQVNTISEYRVAKADALCLFLRRQEYEVIVLDRTKAELLREIEVVVGPVVQVID